MQDVGLEIGRTFYLDGSVISRVSSARFRNYYVIKSGWFI